LEQEEEVKQTQHGTCGKDKKEPKERGRKERGRRGGEEGRGEKGATKEPL